MTDPAVAYLPGEGYGPFDRGTEMDVWMKAANGSSYSLGAVWPGTSDRALHTFQSHVRTDVTVFPDWFNPRTQECVDFFCPLPILTVGQLLDK